MFGSTVFVNNCIIAFIHRCKLNVNFVSNAIVFLLDFFSLNPCLHFLVLFLFCHPYLISSLFWNCLSEPMDCQIIGLITCLSKHLDKLEKNKELLAIKQKKDRDIINAYLHVPLCLFPDTFFIFEQRWSNKWQARILTFAIQGFSEIFYELKSCATLSFLFNKWGK
jgi:hypothetical protein